MPTSRPITRRPFGPSARRVAALLAVLALLAAACGDDGDAAPEDDPTTTTTTEAPPDDTTTTEPAAPTTTLDESGFAGSIDLELDQADDCELTGHECLLPFPSDALTVADDSTATGRRIALPVGAMPMRRAFWRSCI